MISIPNPCPMKWESMTPVAGGNYCDSCCKVVVDFSDCSNEEILNYLSVNSGKRVCGRFLKEQVAFPKPKKRLSQFAAAAFVVFGAFLFASCGNKPEPHIVGDVCFPIDTMREKQWQQDSTHLADSVKAANDAKANSPK